MTKLNKPAIHSLLKEKLGHQLVRKINLGGYIYIYIYGILCGRSLWSIFFYKVIAARNGELQAVEKMLEMGANVDASDPEKVVYIYI